MSTERNSNFYANTGLDRASHLRGDAAWIAARLADTESRIVPVWRSRSLIAGVEADVGPWAWARADASGRPRGRRHTDVR